MSIFRKDKPEEPELVEKEPAGEEYTDISEKADMRETGPDGKMEEIYSTRYKRVKIKREQPLEAEAEAKRKEAAKDELKKGKLELGTSTEKAPEVKLEAELDPNAIVSGEIIEDIADVKKLRNIFVQDIDDIDVSLDPMEGIREYERKVNKNAPQPAPEPEPKPEPEYVPSGDTVVAKVPVYRHESILENIYLKAGRFTDVVESEYDEYLKSADPAISGNYRSVNPALKPHQSLLYTLSQAAARHKSAREQRYINKEIMRSNFDEDPKEQPDKEKKQAKKPKSVDPDKAQRNASVKESKNKPVSDTKAEGTDSVQAAQTEGSAGSEDAVSAEKVKKQPEPEKKKKSKRPSKAGRFFRAFSSSVANSFAEPSQYEQERALDYNTREDEKYLSGRIAKNRKKLIVQFLLTAAVAVVMFSLDIWERTCGAGAIAESGTGVAFIYCGISFILALLLGLANRRTILDGLKPLRRFKANSSTVLALSYAACLLQGLVSMFTSASFAGADHHLYGFIAAFALLLHTAGRLMMVMRVQSNFDFITSRSPAYAARLYDDDETARRMLSGTTAPKGMPAYQHMTSFLSDFLKISYAPDPSEELAGKLTPIAIISAVFVTVLYAIIFKSVQGAVSALTVMLCISIPFTAMLAGNLPLLLFSRRMLDEDAMVAGYPSVRQFGDTSALFMNACDLFPADCVVLEELIPLINYRVEDNLLMAAAVLKEARSPIAPVFDELIAESNGFIPSVESVLYEDKSGLVGWINKERVLIGNINLMNRYHITVPEDSAVSRQRKLGREISYVAVSGQPVAVLCLSYIAPPVIKEQIQHAERNGIAMIASTTDSNVTPELIADRYELFLRSVKVTTPGYSDVIDEVTTRVEETSRAYLATRGRIGSLARAVSGCVNIKANISLGIVISVFGMILGILLCATLALYASVARLSIVELLIYIGFWVAASVISELIKRP